MTKSTTTTETTATEETVATGTQPPDLTINDLNSLKTIIDIASSRGAFKPTEMIAVGQTYTKLAAFLEMIAKQADAAGTV